jgi:hypothetical protein
MSRWRNFLINWVENARLAFELLILPPHKRQRAQHNQTRHRWFYKAAWQRLEGEAEADLREGRYEDFKEIGELIGVLRQNNALEQAEPTSNFDRIAAALRRTVRRARSPKPPQSPQPVERRVKAER